MTKPLYELTDQHRAQLKPWADGWITNALRSSAVPYSAHERADITRNVHDLYTAADLPTPEVVIFAPSPICAAIAAGIGAGCWFLIENPQEHKKLFGIELSEAQIRAAMVHACEVVGGRTPAIARIENAATEQATNQATEQATRQATLQATNQATERATLQATNQATELATNQATEQATLQATRQATYQATEQ